ncbi:unnamed protein product [Adineta steineri]|uniref:NAD(P)-binding domain-containing protein n=1 Tax=Adineta steineri TaxID=433720 RepID=A0A814VC28_9BILA|nr:unnamed protein product [Adineta steineri]CAF4014570.1 unnamed protein product [Adineta steineri]
MESVFKNKRVFITGHTGFKGSWLLQILHLYGAHVKGYALSPQSEEKSLYTQINGNELCVTAVNGDILDEKLLKSELVEFQPDYVFHLAAQAVVKASYQNPVDTFAINVMGTVNVLEAIRCLEKACICIMVTTDKVYENNESAIAFREDDKLGGHDPYSASKGAADIAISSYRSSFFHPDKYNQHHKAIATVRAGNVIGGGDYSHDRIIADIVRSIQRDEPVILRNPTSVRPWQHVLESLFAYLSLAMKMTQAPQKYNTSFNIGPNSDDVLDVETITKKFIQYYGKGLYKTVCEAPHKKFHEAQTLLLNSSKIYELIGWKPKLNVDEAVRMTAEWYSNEKFSAREKCRQQILNYRSRE